MVSIPDSPTKRQGDIVPSTFEEAIAIISGLHQELETAYEDFDTERDYTKDLRDQLSDMARRLEVYVQEQVYQQTLFANPNLSSSEKLVLLASRSVVRELRADDDTSLTDFHLNTIAQQTGLTNETVGKKLHRLDAIFNTVEYKPKKVYAGKDKEGKSLFVSDTKLALLPLVDQPHAIQLPNEAPRHGGAREKKICPHCGSDKVQRAIHICCLECKRTLELTVHMVNEETVGLEQSDADALFILNEAVENAALSADANEPQAEHQSQPCTCTQISENHHDENTGVTPLANVSQETQEYKPAWQCNCRDAYKGWYWSSSVKLWRCTGCHKNASETRQKAMQL